MKRITIVTITKGPINL